MTDTYLRALETGDSQINELLVAAMQEVDGIAQQRLDALSRQYNEVLIRLAVMRRKVLETVARQDIQAQAQSGDLMTQLMQRHPFLFFEGLPSDFLNSVKSIRRYRKQIENARGLRGRIIQLQETFGSRVSEVLIDAIPSFVSEQDTELETLAQAAITQAQNKQPGQGEAEGELAELGADEEAQELEADARGAVHFEGDVGRRIFELQTALKRCGIADVNDLSAYLVRFRAMAEGLQNMSSEIAVKIRDVLDACIVLIEVATTESHAASTLDYAIKFFWERLREIKMPAARIFNRPEMELAQAEVELGNEVQDRARDAKSEAKKSRRGREPKAAPRGTKFVIADDSPISDPEQLFSTLRNAVKYGVFWEFIDKIFRDHKDKESREAAFVFVMYSQMLKSLSCDLQARKIRLRTPQILHSTTIDTEGFTRALEREDWPVPLWRQQKEMLQAIANGLKRSCRRMYVELPPGTGKTLPLLLAAKYLNPDGNTALCVPNLHLTGQHKREREKHRVDVEAGIVGGHQGITDQQLTVITYSSLLEYIRNELFAADKFSLLLFDEVHKMLGAAGRQIARHFKNAVCIGATAADRDISGRMVSSLFDCVYFISLSDGIRAGIVNPIRLHTIHMPSRYRKCRTDDEILAVDLRSRKEALYEWYREHGERDSEQMLILTDVNQETEEIAGHFTQNRIQAHAIHSARTRSDMSYFDILFREGKFPVAVATKVLQEGWDHPSLRLIGLARQGKFGWLEAQKIGRVARRIDPTKKDSHVVELRGGFAENRSRGRHTLMKLSEDSPIDDLFSLDRSQFKNGSRVIEPKPGFWPDTSRFL